jgi:hypothetical protein
MVSQGSSALAVRRSLVMMIVIVAAALEVLLGAVKLKPW